MNWESLLFRDNTEDIQKLRDRIRILTQKANEINEKRELVDKYSYFPWYLQQEMMVRLRGPFNRLKISPRNQQSIMRLVCSFNESRANRVIDVIPERSLKVENILLVFFMIAAAIFVII